MKNGQLTAHFNLSEFRCPCCGDAIETAAQHLAQRLEPVREIYGPILIWSGFRCPKQNAKIGGALFSQHMTGLAADIAVPGDADRFNLVKLLIEHGFCRLGIATNYVHADIAAATGPVIWTYYARH